MSGVEIYRAKVEELVRQSDITTVSARGIRKKVEALMNTSLDHVKREFDDLVMGIYEKITDDIERSVLNGSQNTAPQQHNQPTTQPPIAPPPQAQGFQFALPPTSFVPPAPKPKPKPKSKPAPKPVKVESEDDDVDSDGSFSSVDEGKSRTIKKAKTSSTTKKTSKSKSSKKDKDEDKPKKKRKQPMNEDGTPKVNNFNRPMIISDTLIDIIGKYGSIGPSGKMEMSRPEVVKHMWAYIKENNLQAEDNKRMINCDSKLKNLFDGESQISCFTMNKYF
ncbi:hypothetical protein BGZ76_003143, partial [Entomortierella beljakovae]